MAERYKDYTKDVDAFIDMAYSLRKRLRFIKTGVIIDPASLGAIRNQSTALKEMSFRLREETEAITSGGWGGGGGGGGGGISISPNPDGTWLIAGPGIIENTDGTWTIG